MPAFAATADPRAQADRVSAWQAQTTRTLAVHTLQGDHFAVLKQTAFVHACVGGELAAPLQPA